MAEANSATEIDDLREFTSEIVSAYVARNPIPSSDLPALISQVGAALVKLSAPDAPESIQPIVPTKKTIMPDYLLSLEDGKRYKTLKRHLARYGLTPDEYRKKWGLPGDYPMVSPNYAVARSKLAKQLGLGRKPSAKAPTKGERST